MESKDKRKCKYPQLNDANCMYIIDIDISSINSSHTHIFHLKHVANALAYATPTIARVGRIIYLVETTVGVHLISVRIRRRIDKIFEDSLHRHRQRYPTKDLVLLLYPLHQMVIQTIMIPIAVYQSERILYQTKSTTTRQTVHFTINTNVV